VSTALALLTGMTGISLHVHMYTIHLHLTLTFLIN
jgi:hypothetical protein